jgi:hypothetical protein
MSDFRNYNDPNDPLNRNMGYEPEARDSAWGWIAVAVCLVIILAIAFGASREPSRVASNDVAPPAATHPAGPPNAANPAAPPGLVPPPAPAQAPSFAPNRP